MQQFTSDKMKFISGGYSKKGKPARPEDAVILGLKRGDHDKIYVCDEFDNLEMFHFREDYVSEETEEDALYEERMRISSVRGWIVDSNTKKLISKSYTEVATYFTEPEPLFETDWSGWTFKPYIEGMTIRVFWNNDRWVHSTHRKIDCRNSRIPGVELEIFKIFQECLPQMNYDTDLDKECVYVFQIVHQDNQIMNPFPVPKPVVLHLATFRDGNVMSPFPEKVIPGCLYTQDLILEHAVDLVKAGWCCLAINGNEIIQVAAISMGYLMQIRAADTMPYIPPELMYLRLSTFDRPNLVHATSYHLKEKVSPEHMEPWIEYNCGKLALFCAQQLHAKTSGNGLSLSKPLTDLMKRVKLHADNASVEKIHAAFKELIKIMIENEGAVLYRCIKDMDSTIVKLNRMVAATIAAQANPNVPMNKNGKKK